MKTADQTAVRRKVFKEGYILVELHSKWHEKDIGNHYQNNAKFSIFFVKYHKKLFNFHPKGYIIPFSTVKKY